MVDERRAKGFVLRDLTKKELDEANHLARTKGVDRAARYIEKLNRDVGPKISRVNIVAELIEKGLDALRPKKKEKEEAKA